LVVALLSAVRFRHRMPSCNRQRSRCWTLLPPIVVHRRDRRRCQCRRAATASTATTVVKLAVVHCQRKRQQQQHHQCTNGSTNVKTFTSPDDLDLFNLSIVFEVCDDGRGNFTISKLLAFKKLYLFCNLHTARLDEITYVFGSWCAQFTSLLLHSQSQRGRVAKPQLPMGTRLQH
jgi:hypothetical protein